MPTFKMSGRHLKSLRLSLRRLSCSSSRLFPRCCVPRLSSSLTSDVFPQFLDLFQRFSSSSTPNVPSPKSGGETQNDTLNETLAAEHFDSGVSENREGSDSKSENRDGSEEESETTHKVVSDIRSTVNELKTVVSEQSNIVKEINNVVSEQAQVKPINQVFDTMSKVQGTMGMAGNVLGLFRFGKKLNDYGFVKTMEDIRRNSLGGEPPKLTAAGGGLNQTPSGEACLEACRNLYYKVYEMDAKFESRFNEVVGIFNGSASSVPFKGSKSTSSVPLKGSKSGGDEPAGGGGSGADASGSGVGGSGVVDGGGGDVSVGEGVKAVDGVAIDKSGSSGVDDGKGGSPGSGGGGEATGGEVDAGDGGEAAEAVGEAAKAAFRWFPWW